MSWQEKWVYLKEEDQIPVEISKTSTLSTAGKIIGKTPALEGLTGIFQGIGEGYVVEDYGFSGNPTIITVNKNDRHIRRK